MEDWSCPRLDRRQALHLIGAGGLGLLAAGRTAGGLLAAPRRAGSGARQVSFQEGAVIRTIFTDLSPDALAHARRYSMSTSTASTRARRASSSFRLRRRPISLP